MSLSYIIAVIAVMTFVTFSLRLVPFVFTRLFKESQLLRYMGEHMPVGIMLMLFLYTIKDQQLFTSQIGHMTLGCTLLAAIIYWLCNSALVAILVSLGCYLVLVNFIV